MTMEQFLQLPDEESRRYELWQGELVDVGETIFDHSSTQRIGNHSTPFG